MECFPNHIPLFASAAGASQFWQDLVCVRDEFRGHVGNGASIPFLMDWWHNDTPLSIQRFPFRIALLYWFPSQNYRNNWDLGIRCSLSPEELVKWQCLAPIFLVLSDLSDQVTWPHNASHRFCVKSLYSRLIVGSPSTKFKHIWRAKIPLRINKLCGKLFGESSQMVCSLWFAWKF